MQLPIEPHPSLLARTFVTRFPLPLSDCAVPSAITALFTSDAPAPMPPPDDSVRKSIRDLLRQ